MAFPSLRRFSSRGKSTSASPASDGVLVKSGSVSVALPVVALSSSLPHCGYSWGKRRLPASSRSKGEQAARAREGKAGFDITFWNLVSELSQGLDFRSTSPIRIATIIAATLDYKVAADRRKRCWLRETPYRWRLWDGVSRKLWSRSVCPRLRECKFASSSANWDRISIDIPSFHSIDHSWVELEHAMRGIIALVGQVVFNWHSAAIVASVVLAHLSCLSIFIFYEFHLGLLVAEHHSQDYGIRLDTFRLVLFLFICISKAWQTHSLAVQVWTISSLSVNVMSVL